MLFFFIGIAFSSLIFIIAYIVFENTGRYSVIKKEFGFLQSDYGFQIYMKQKRGSYYYIVYTNEKKKIAVFYDDTVDEKAENPIFIQIYDADCLGIDDDDVDKYKSEFYISSGSPKERLRIAAKWLKNAIESKTVLIEKRGYGERNQR